MSTSLTKGAWVEFTGHGVPDSSGTVVLGVRHLRCDVTVDAGSGVASASKVYAVVVKEEVGVEKPK